MTTHELKIAPSILAADYAVLADEVARVREEVDWLHVDLMDGHFVPNLSIGPPVVASLRKHTDLFLDCHLMVTEPARWVEPLAEAGADLCAIHVELGDPTPLLVRIRSLGMRAGLVVDGPTPFDVVEPYLDDRIDLLLVMTIKAGFGGQAFQPEQVSKVERAVRLREERGATFLVEVDGGVKIDTAPLVARAGADVLVSGTGIFAQPDPPAAARDLRAVAERAFSAR
jgi:ribulose-phosphate 3-epimerase